MSDTVKVKMHFENIEERLRYFNVNKEQGPRDACGMGVYTAKKYILPLIYRNNGAHTQEQLMNMTNDGLKAGFTDLTSFLNRQPTDDEYFMFRMGYQALTLEALESHYRASRACEKLGEGLALALAGIAACEEGLRILGEPEVPTFLAPPCGHLLSMGAPSKRPLRPEDFGCLPQAPRRR